MRIWKLLVTLRQQNGKHICQFHVHHEGTRNLPRHVPILSPKPDSATPQPYQRPQNEHVSHGKAASLLALPNTWANSLCNFWKAVHGTKNMNVPAKPANEMPFLRLILPRWNKIISKIKVQFFSFLCFQKIFFFLDENPHLEPVGWGENYSWRKHGC